MHNNNYVFKLSNYQIDNILIPFLNSKFSKMDSTYMVDFYCTGGLCKPNFYKKVCTRCPELKEELETTLGVRLNDDQELMTKINKEKECLIN